MAEDIFYTLLLNFVKLQEMITSNKELAQKLTELERKIGVHDAEIQAIYEAIRRLLEPPPQPRRQIACLPQAGI